MKFTVVTAFFISILIISSIVFGCSGSPDSWFKILFSFNNSTFPEGVSILETHPVLEPYAITNKNLEPFYIAAQRYDGAYFPNSELPPDYKFGYKLQSGKVYFYDESEWQPNYGGINNASATQLNLFAYSNVIVFEGGSKNVYEDYRPDLVEIPEPQKFKIFAYYKGNPHEITGIAIYRLNDEYEPGAYAKFMRSCIGKYDDDTVVSSIETFVVLTVAMMTQQYWLLYYLFF